MRWGIAVVIVLGMVGASGEAAAEWQQAFRTVSDTKIHSFQSDSAHTGRMLIGIEGGILESKDRGATWKRVLTIPSNQAVQILNQEPGLQRWWAVTSKAIYKSADGGRRWESAAQFLSSAGRIECLLVDGATLYAGRSDGLEVSYDEGSTWVNVPAFSGRPVFQISRAETGEVWIASDSGVYRSGPHRSWERIYQRVSLGHDSLESEAPAETEDPDSNDANTGDRVYFWFTSDGGVAIIDGIKKIHFDAATGQSRSAGALSLPVVLAPRTMGEKSVRTVLATEHGVGLWDESGQVIQELTAGWPGSAPRSLVYDPVDDQLIAVTPHGVFQYEHPDLNSYLEMRLRSGEHKTQALLDQFAHEPNILELQEAAMRYAEVHPEKIIAWRELAAKRAWLPSLGIGHDAGIDQTVDIDRGGTNDVDRFIQGPDEKDRQWSVDVSWNLGDLIWSDDQTSIDNRSKLMVQLRDDLLTQLNHLYYSRRRLQVARLVESGSGMQKEIDRSLQIDEYTAGIDALTGGYFSKKLNQTAHLEERIVLS